MNSIKNVCVYSASSTKIDASYFQAAQELGHLLARQHINANVLVMPGRFIDEAMADKIMTEFFTTDFEGGRHQARIDKIPVR